ncbi:hypothetical protein G6F22_010713 [Rhizopus arrhizus]|nr:hypothetical protein G6F22_010713 [Rhizopus arrhizus]
MVRTYPVASPHFDPARVAAWSAAIALHLLAFLLLLIPATYQAITTLPPAAAAAQVRGAAACGRRAEAAERAEGNNAVANADRHAGGGAGHRHARRRIDTGAVGPGHRPFDAVGRCPVAIPQRPTAVLPGAGTAQPRAGHGAAAGGGRQQRPTGRGQHRAQQRLAQPGPGRSPAGAQALALRARTA